MNHCWLVEVLHEGDWLPSMDTIPHDTRNDAREAAKFVRRYNRQGKYRVRRYVRAD